MPFIYVAAVVTTDDRSDSHPDPALPDRVKRAPTIQQGKNSLYSSTQTAKMADLPDLHTPINETAPDEVISNQYAEVGIQW